MRQKATWLHPQSKHWHLLDYVLVRRQDHQDVLGTKAIPSVDGWTDHRFVISKMRLRLQPRKRPQGKRQSLRRPPYRCKQDSLLPKSPPCTTTAVGDAGCLDDRQIQGNSRAVNGPTVKGTALLLCADRRTLLTEKTQILTRWAEHFQSVLNQPSTISDAAIDRLPDVEINATIDHPPFLKETIRSVQQLSSEKWSRLFTANCCSCRLVEPDFPVWPQYTALQLLPMIL
ncbi:unnamed protein product [Schistocephalus solidus]|uniref:Endo/exonuclease/phosphatase domain-containing protein n=1 Tax=Schistocephalus solidus TaxID=70667 RepID=A0A183SFG8_SCHSO|nr:unnamed protein product [Schistocephalus solidus]